MRKRADLSRAAFPLTPPLSQSLLLCQEIDGVIVWFGLGLVVWSRCQSRRVR